VPNPFSLDPSFLSERTFSLSLHSGSLFPPVFQSESFNEKLNMGYGDSDDDDRYNYTQDLNGHSRGPSCFDRVKIGAEMGGAIGLCVGLLLGGFTAFT
jgi:hypothetical protein